MGSSHAFRIEHVKFDDLYAGHFIEFTGDLWGVLDHSVFSTTRTTIALKLNHSTWGGIGDYGDNSWATPSNYGSEQFIFIDDNTFTAVGGGVKAATDADGGARFV